MDATCTIQDSIHVFRLVHKYVSRILGTYHNLGVFCCHFLLLFVLFRSIPLLLQQENKYDTYDNSGNETRGYYPVALVVPASYQQ